MRMRLGGPDVRLHSLPTRWVGRAGQAGVVGRTTRRWQWSTLRTIDDGKTVILLQWAALQRTATAH